MTQGRKLIAALRRTPHTYMEMLALGISVAPWLRISESLARNESLVKGKRYMGDGRYLTTWRVVKATP